MQKKKLIYNFGSRYGFFSEYNNMILCYLYCLCNNIDFVLFDSNCRFSEQHDYLDYFIPFCATDRHSFNKYYNRRDFFGEMGWKSMVKDLFSRSKSYDVFPLKRMQLRLFGDVFKKIYGFNFYTYELFASARNRQLEHQYFHYDDISIDGDLQDSCRKIIDRLWVYKPNVEEKVRQYVRSVSMPKEYVGIHIRRGDKVIEYDLQDTDKYMSLLEMHSDLRVAFVLTDDYGVFLKLKANYPKWEFRTLCEESERGYFHKDFMAQTDIGAIATRHIKLFASMDILSKAQVFVGTFSSNPGMYLGMRMEKGRVFGVDFENWRIW